jgi:hypothetical protein
VVSTTYPVRVWAGWDYNNPPASGPGLVPADALTNPAAWTAYGFGYDNTQPAPVPVAGGMRLSWAIDPDKGALQAVPITYTAGHTYLLTLSATADDDTWEWRMSWGYGNGHYTPLHRGTGETTLTWLCPETKVHPFGIEASALADGHNITVTRLGVWDLSDPTVVWNPLELNTCDVLMPLTITHGRSEIGSQPDAPQCSFDYVGPTAPQLGSPMRVQATDNSGGWADPRITWGASAWTWGGNDGTTTRFEGTVTSVVAVESLGQVVRWQVEGTGVQAALGAEPVLLSRPTETDVARVQAIAAAAGTTVTIRGTSTLQLRADEIDRDALAAIHEVAESAGGLFWQDADGTLNYGTANHRDDPATRTLPCDVIEDGVEWRTDLSLIINHVVLTWGEPGTETQDTWRDDPSITQWGMRSVRVDTLAADRTQAGALAALILARRRQPYWRMPGVVIDYDWLGSNTAAALATRVGDAVIMPVPTLPGPTPATATRWLVEGWAEVWDTGGHLQQFAVSDPARSVTGRIVSWNTQRSRTWATWRPLSWTDQLVEVPA